MVQIGYLQAKFDADVANFIKDMGRAADATEKTQKAITGAIGMMNGALGTLGVSLGAGAIFGKMMKEASEAESAAKKVEAILRATGGAAGITAKQVDSVAESLSKLTGIDDDAIKGGQALLLTFKNIGKDVFPAATEAMLDMSETMGSDLKGAAVQLGKALQDPIKGTTALHKIGIEFSAGQKAVIESFVKTGQTAKAQAVILREIQEEMGGTAAAARDTLAGSLKALDTAFGNLFENLGSSGAMDLIRNGIETLVIWVEKLSDAVASNGFKHWLNEIQTGFEVAYQSVKPLIDAIDKLIRINEAMNKLPQIKTPQDLLKYGSQLASIFKDLGKASDQYKNGFDKIAEEVEKRRAELEGRAKKAGHGTAKAFTDGVDAHLAKYKKQGWLLDSGADLFTDKGMPSKGWMNKESQDSLLFTDLSSDKLKEINTQLEQELEKQKLITAGNQEQLMHLEAQQKLKEIIFSSDEERVKAEQHIVDLMKQQKELQAVAAANNSIEQMKEGNELLAAKVDGLEEEYLAQKKLKDLLKDVNDPATINDITRRYNAEIEGARKLKDQLDLQKKTLEEIKNSTDGYISKQKQLQDALAKGVINGKQYAQTLEEIQKKSQEAFTKSVKDWTNHVFDSFGKAIMEGKKLNEVFKDLGKELGLLAAKKLLFEPIANAIGNWAGKLYGGTMFGAPGSTGGNTGMASGGGLLGKIAGLFGKGGGGQMPPLAPNYQTGGGFGPVAGNGQSGSQSGNSSGILNGGQFAPDQLGSTNPGLADFMQKNAPGWLVPLLTNNKNGLALKTSEADPVWQDALAGNHNRLLEIRNVLKFAEVGSASGTAIRVWVANFGAENQGDQKFKNPFRTGGDAGSSGSSSGLTINADALVPLIQSLIGTSKGGPAWKVVMPDCPCPGGYGQPGGTLAGGGMGGGTGGMMPGGQFGGFGGPITVGGLDPNWEAMAQRNTPSGGGVNSQLGQRDMYGNIIGDPYGNLAARAGMGAGGGSNMPTIGMSGPWAHQQRGFQGTVLPTSGIFGNAPEYDEYMRRAAAMKQGGNFFGTMPTQANFKANSPLGFQPQPFVLSGNPYGMNTQMNVGEEGSFKPGLTGGVNHAPMYSAWGAGTSGMSAVMQGEGFGGFPGASNPYFGMDANPAIARLTTAYGGGGITMNTTKPQDNPNWMNSPGGRSIYGEPNLYGMNPVGFANGGNPPVGIPSIVGERGPELFVPKRSGTILPNDRLKEIMGGGSSPVVNLHDYTSTPSQIASQNVGSDGSINVVLRDAMAAMQSDPRIQRAQNRATGSKNRGVRRG